MLKQALQQGLQCRSECLVEDSGNNPQLLVFSTPRHRQ